MSRIWVNRRQRPDGKGKSGRLAIPERLCGADRSHPLIPKESKNTGAKPPLLRCENHGQTRYAAGTAVHSPYAGFGTWPPAGVSGLFVRLLTFYDLFSVKSLVGHRDLISSVDGYWTARHVMQALSLSAITAQLLVVSRIFRKMVCCLPSEWCVATSFYQRAPNHVSLFLRNLFYLTRQSV